MHETYLRIGGLSIRLRSEVLSSAHLAEGYHTFISDREGPLDLDVLVRISSDLPGANGADLAVLRSAIGRRLEQGLVPRPDPDNWLRWQVELGRRFLHDPGFVEALQAYNPKQGPWRLFKLSGSGAWFVDTNAGKASFYLVPDRRVGIVPQLAGYLSRFLHLALAQREGLLLHAAGVVADGGAYVFMGPSGSGKTTIARAARERGWPVLADDGLIVRRMEDGQFWAFRTLWNAAGPLWQGGFGPAPDSVPVQAVFFQQHGEADRWERLDSITGPVRVVGAALPQLRQLEGWNSQVALGLLAELGRQVPCYDLWFTVGCGFLGRISE